MNTIHPKSLRYLSYGGQVPFAVSTGIGNRDIFCTDILRIIPGRRIVCRARLQDMDVIAKFFIDPLRSGRHVKREVNGLSALRAAGIPTPGTIAELSIAGHVRVLITEYLANTQRPSIVLKVHPESQDAQRVLRQFLALIAASHRAGLAQNDLHLDSFFLKDGTLYAIDAANVRNTTFPLSHKASLDNLALFFAQFDPDLYPQLFTALESYHEANPSVAISQQELIDKAISKRGRIWKRLSRKCFADCTRFVRRRTSRRMVLCRRDHYDGAFVTFLDNPDVFIEGSALLKNGDSSTVAIVEIRGCKYVVKRFNTKNLLTLIRRQFQPSRARRNWLLGHLLRFNGFNTPEPIAMIEKRFGPFRAASYIVTEFVDAPDIRQALRRANGNAAKQDEILDIFISTLARLHDRKITHGDMKDTNILYIGARVCILDLDAMKMHRLSWMLRRAIQKDRRRLRQNYENDSTLLKVLGHKLAQQLPATAATLNWECCDRSL